MCSTITLHCFVLKAVCTYSALYLCTSGPLMRSFCRVLTAVHVTKASKANQTKMHLSTVKQLSVSVMLLDLWLRLRQGILS